MQSKKEFIKLDVKNKDIKAGLLTLEFFDNGHTVIYIPSLNLSAYGKDHDEASLMLLDVVLDDYFENLLLLPERQIFTELKTKGWERSRIFDKELSNNAYIDREGVLRDFNLPKETKFRENLISV